MVFLRSRRVPSISWLATATLLLVLASCASPSNSEGPAGDETRLDVRIGTAATSMVIGETRPFTAQITGGEPATLTWTPSCGVVEGSGETVTYTAPMAPGTCSLTVSTTVDPDEQHTVFVTVTGAGEGLEVSTVPSEANLDAGGRITVTADVRGAEESDLTWSATCGDVDGQGRTALYAAPDTPGSCIVTAASVLDPSRSSSSRFTIEAAETAVSIRTVPEQASVYVDTPLFIDAFVSGSSNANVTWTTTCGQVFGMGPAATFEAPSTPSSCTVTARSDADPNQSATTVVTVEALPIEESVVLNPTAASVQAGSSTSLAAIVTVDGDPSVTWDATCGTIVDEGPPFAPMAFPTMHSILFEAPMEAEECTVTVTSNEDPTISASAIVTVTSIPIEVSVSVAPKNATIRFGETIDLQANVTVTGAEDASVVWTSSCGTLTQTTTGATLTAPQIAGTCIATATSQLDPTKSASATIQVLEPIQVTVTPSVVVMAPGGERTFEASVTGTSDVGVDWTSTCGTVTGSGSPITYVAPAQAGSCLVTATSTADPTKRFQSSVIIEEPTRVSIDPSEVTLKVGATQSFTATVTGSSGGSVTWNATCGTVNGTGTTVTYVAPSQPGTCSVTATSTADSTQHAQSIVTVEPEVAIQVDPTSVELETGAQHVFLATVTGTSNTHVTWSTTCGQVAGAGLEVTYTAPSSAGTCSVTVRSSANPAKLAESIVTVEEAPRPDIPPTIENFAIGTHHTIVVASDGNLYGSGYNRFGQIGDNGIQDQFEPTRVHLPAGVEFASLSGGTSGTFGITVDGRIFGWGNNAYGQIGDFPSRVRVPTEVPLPEGVEFVKIEAGGWMTLALGTDGQAYAWGSNRWGALGDGTTDDRSFPMRVHAPENVDFTDISSSGSYSLAVGSDGNVYAWGRNTTNRLGTGVSGDHFTPLRVITPDGVKFDKVIAAGTFSLAVDENGIAYAWGSGSNGQIGDGTFSSRTYPTRVAMPAGITVADASASASNAVALGSDGNLYTWGWNERGAVGDGTMENRNTPYRVQPPTGVRFIRAEAGNGHVGALGDDGNLYVWGLNRNGQLGNGTMSPSLLPSKYVLD